MAKLDVDGALQNVKTMLSGLTWWQGVCQVSTTALAALSIYEGGVEKEPEESAAPCIILDIDPLNTDWMATSRGQLTVTVHVEIPIPAESQTNYQAKYRYAWQQFGSMMEGINGAVNGSGQLMLQGMNVTQEPGEFDPKETGNRCEWGWIISLVLDFF